MGDFRAALHWILTSSANQLEWVALYSIIFFPLALCFPSKPSQPMFRKDMATDLAFFFITPVYGSIQVVLQVFLFTSLRSITALGILTEQGKPYLSMWPLGLQVLVIFIATDFLQYWTHRISHKQFLWKLHAIHHSSKNVDWLSSVRWHPINFLYHITFTQAVVWSLGFSVEAFPLVLILNGLNSALVHANMNWTYGPLRYVIASPIFHRWHHTKPSQGGNKNFAPFFSVFDLIFGTFYMPKDAVPTDFGTPYDPIPDNVMGQIVYPFRKKSAVKS